MIKSTLLKTHYVFHFTRCHLILRGQRQTDKRDSRSHNIQLLLWFLSCRRSWTRFLCVFRRMACLQLPVRRSGSIICGSSCSERKRGVTRSPRRCRPYVHSRPVRWRRWDSSSVLGHQQLQKYYRPLDQNLRLPNIESNLLNCYSQRLVNIKDTLTDHTGLWAQE